MTASETLITEINLNKLREDNTFSLSNIGNRKVKTETILYNFNRIVNKSDIAYVDYTSGGKPSNEPLFPLNSLFSDNIVVYCCISDELVKDIKLGDQPAGENLSAESKNDDEEDDEISSIKDPALCRVSKAQLPKFTANVKSIFNLLGLPINKMHIKPIGVIDLNRKQCQHKPSRFAQLLKVNLGYCSYSDVIEVVTTKAKLDIMHKNNIYVHDIDFTRDYKGVFNKDKLIEHLIDKHNFCLQNNLNDNDDNDESPATILDNSRIVSNNCLTFMCDNVRYKFYNKFIQSMESPSVRTKIGSHIGDWCNNPESILRDAINKSLDTGLLRLELTIYTYNSTELLTEKYITSRMKYLENLMNTEAETSVIYYNPISTQFNLLCECVLYNVCIFDVETRLAFVVLYQNTLTGKANGFYIKDCTTGKLSNALKYYCSNKPIIVILMSIDKDNGIVSTQQDTYVRVQTTGELATFLTKGSELLKSLRPNLAFKQPIEVGLLPNTVFNFQISTTVLSLLKNNRNNIKFRLLASDAMQLKYPNNDNTLRAINRQIREESNENTFAAIHKSKLESITEINKDIENELVLIRHQETVRNKLYDILKDYRAFARKFLDYADDTVLFCYAFKSVHTQYGDTFLLACSADEVMTETTEINMVWSTANITRTIATNLDKYKKLNIFQITAFGSLSGFPILTLQKTGTYTNKNKNKCASVKLIESHDNSNENDIPTNNNMRELGHDIKIVNCKNLDDVVNEGDIITITGYRELKTSILLQAKINGNISHYKGSYWIKDIMRDHIAGYIRHKEDNVVVRTRMRPEDESVRILNIVAGVYKTTPQKHKARMYTNPDNNNDEDKYNNVCKRVHGQT